jgi:hypothetical protein
MGLDVTAVITICLQMYAYFCVHGIGGWLEDQGEKIYVYIVLRKLDI